MGSPVLEADQVPVICEHTLAIDEPITVNGVEYRMTGVSMGNPHAVVFTNHVRGLELEWLGRHLSIMEDFQEELMWSLRRS